MRGRKRGWLGLLGLALLSGNSATAENPAEVRFKLCGDYMVVARGSIGELHELNFLIDTGAVPSVVDQRIANNLRLIGTAEKISVFNRSLEASRVVLPSVHLGAIKAQSVKALVRDLSFIEEGLGVRIDAMIGLDVLGGRNFTVDYAARRITFGRSSPGEAPIPLEARQGFVLVRLEVGGESLRLVVDTGARDLVLFQSRVRARLANVRILGGKSSSNLSGVVQLQQVELGRVRIGETDLGSRKAVVLDDAGQLPAGVDGLLGVRWLQASRVAFNLQSRTFVFAH